MPDETSASNRPARIAAFDVIRACAIVQVVLLHAAAPVIYARATHPDTGWWIANLVDAGSRSCVPLFVMLSGALLLDDARSTQAGAFLARRLAKIVLPAAAWLLIYLLYGHGFRVAELTVGEVARAAVTGAVPYHFWYLYMLVGLYLATPILAVFVRQATAAQARYFLLLALAVPALLPLVKSAWGLEVGVPFVATTGYAGYFVAGHYLKSVAVTPRQRRGLAVVFAALGLFTAAGTFAEVRAAGSYLGLFYDFHSPGVVLMSLAAFLWLVHGEYGARRLRFARLLAAASFGIYLVHVLVQTEIARLPLTALALPPGVGIAATAAAVLGISLGLVLLGRRVPGVRLLFP